MVKVILIALLFAISNCFLLSTHAENWSELMDSCNVSLEHQDFRTAMQFSMEALNSAKVEYGEIDSNYIKTLGIISEIYYYLGKLDSAIYFAEMRLKSTRTNLPQDHIALLEGIHNLAFFLRVNGNYTDAEPLYLEALEISRGFFITDHHDLANSLNGLALFYDEIGNYNAAEQLYIEAIEMRRRIFKGDHPELATSINNMATYYFGRGDYNAAEPLFHEAMEMRRRIYKGDHPDLATSINNMAIFNSSLGNYDTAVKLFNEALEMKRRLYKEDNFELALSINNLGAFYDDRGSHVEAELLYKEALELYRGLIDGDHPELANLLNNMAMFYHSRRNYTEAELYYNEALEMKRRLYIGDHQSVAESLAWLANFYNAIDNKNSAELLFIESINMYKRIFISQSINLSEREKEEYWKTLKQHFERFNSFSIERMSNKPQINETTYNNLLFFKGLLLKSNIKMKNTILNSNDEKLINRFNEWVSIKEQLVRYYSMTKNELKSVNCNLDSLENVSNIIEKELALFSEGFTNVLDKYLYTWQDVKKNLRDNEAAIEIVRFKYYDGKRWTDSIYYSALIITSETDMPELVLLENGNDLENKYSSIYRNLIKFSTKSITNDDIRNTTLKELYSEYWVKIKSKLDGINKVYLSPDGIYNLLNLNTLINPETNKYILEEIDLRIVSSTRDIINKKYNEINSNNNMIAELFGDPKFNLDIEQQQEIASQYTYEINSTKSDSSRYSIYDVRNELIPLSGTKIEVERISEEFKKNKWMVNVHIGKDAIEEAVKSLDNPRVLHIATHGDFIEDSELEGNSLGMEQDVIVQNPLLRSRLLLAGVSNSLKNRDNNKTDDGILTAYEAMNLNLDKTELVVLSACETGLGELKNGEGVYGLQRSFLVAGAKTIIMTLWKVNDVVTQELMVYFYRNWLSGQPKHQAFTEAQQKIKKKYSHPYFWGAFVMIGE